ncbi:membrane protein insertion efficiency factor YidD [Ruania albidiflava]|uniref:membrane protein insertion efficiency factor YidD n=1 Tax=Ruania albidiflava TaxID=366586 RepID=UPI0030B8DA45
MTARHSSRHPVTWLLTMMVRGYQLIVSPWLAPRCRYYPSCSAYGLEALRRHSPLTGTVLAAWRVLRCNPWSAGGVDEVPAQTNLPWRRRAGTTGEHGDDRCQADGSPSHADRLAYGADRSLDHRLSHQGPHQRI